MLAFIIYLLSTIDGLKNLLGVIGIVGSIGWTIGIVACYIDKDSEYTSNKIMAKKWFPACKKWARVCIIILFIFILTPSSKTLAAIYLIPKIVNNENVKNIPNKALKILNLKLDEYIKSYLPEKKNLNN